MVSLFALTVKQIVTRGAGGTQRIKLNAFLWLSFRPTVACGLKERDICETQNSAPGSDLSKGWKSMVALENETLSYTVFKIDWKLDFQ